MKEALKPDVPIAVPKARVWSGIVGRSYAELFVDLGEGEVLFLQTATLAGACKACRYRETAEAKKEREEGDCPQFSQQGVYLNTCRVKDTGDFQLQIRRDCVCDGQHDHYKNQ